MTRPRWLPPFIEIRSPGSAPSRRPAPASSDASRIPDRDGSPARPVHARELVQGASDEQQIRVLANAFDNLTGRNGGSCAIGAWIGLGLAAIGAPDELRRTMQSGSAAAAAAEHGRPQGPEYQWIRMPAARFWCLYGPIDWAVHENSRTACGLPFQYPPASALGATFAERPKPCCPRCVALANLGGE